MKKALLSVLLLTGLSATISSAQAGPLLDRYTERACEIYCEMQTIRLLVQEFGDLDAATKKLKDLEAEWYGLGEDTDPAATEAVVNKTDWVRFIHAQPILEQAHRIEAEVMPRP